MASISSSSGVTNPPRARLIPWSSQTTHTNGHIHTGSESEDVDDESRSPASIFTRTFILAIIFGSSLALFLYLLLIEPSPFWRLPFFLLALSLFHSLEYYMTARYNPSGATTSAFLLNNGKEYNIAHCLAFLECGFHLYFLPNYHFPNAIHQLALCIGSILLIGGQYARSAAMKTAGSNFNHIVQSEKKNDHVLVTEGIYRYLRHPSYFGFFWWGLGTQILLGNIVCLVGYAYVLWRFFEKRIRRKLRPARLGQRPFERFDMT